MDNTTSIDKLTEAYVRLRDKKKELDEQHKEKMKPIQFMMEKLENTLQGRLIEAGARSIKTEHGTPYLQERVSATVDDGEAFFQYVRETGAFDLLEKRVAKTAYEDRVKSGEQVPGVRRTVEVKLNVRRS